MSDKVNWFYCWRCKKDVEAELKVSLRVPEYHGKVVASVDAVCCECQLTITSGESYPFEIGG